MIYTIHYRARLWRLLPLLFWHTWEKEASEDEARLMAMQLADMGLQNVSVHAGDCDEDCP